MLRTDQALRAALLELLAREGLDAITVRGICAQAGVHYATFFRHHSSKEALLDHVARDQIDRLVALALPVSDVSGDSAGFQALFAYVDEHRQLWSALLTGGAGAAMREELLKVSMAVAQRRKPRKALLPVELATVCSVMLIIETIAWWLRQPEKAYPVKKIAAILHRTLHSANLLDYGAGPKRRRRPPAVP